MEEVMKKILRGILMLTLWMVLCLVPIQANAEGENPIELTQDNYKSYLGLGSYNKSYLPSGSYILMEDITLDDTLLIGCEGQFNEVDFSDVNVTLDLNGYVLRQGNIQEFPVIQVYQGSTLTIQDSRPEVTHKFTADSTGLWKLDEADGDKTVNGGVITGSVKTGLVLQAVDMNKDSYVARCTMNGGNIVGCTYSSHGGGVSVGDKAEFTMNGGSIRGCTVTDPQHGFGGGVYVVSGTFTMNGGMISDCASATTDGGDALFMANGVNAGKSSFSMSADATINGSFKDANPGASEGSLGVYTVTFNSDGGTPVPSQVRPQGAAAVKPADPTKSGLDFGGWYIGETAYDFTQPVTANLTLTAKWTQHIHCVCGENGNHTDIGDHTAHTDEVWTAWTATDRLPETRGNYYLVNDVDIAEGSTDWNVYGNIKLCLNGKKVTMNGAAIIVDMREFSLTDCVGSGKIIGGSGVSSGGSSVVNLRRHATFNLYGGSISNISPANGGNSVVYFDDIMNECTFNMYGGTLGDPDGAVGEDRDGVYIKFAEEAENGNIFNAYGGRVRGVISKTYDQGFYDEVGTINFGGTLFESKVYLSKGSNDAPKLSGDGEKVYFYPSRILAGTTWVRIDEKNKGDVLGDGSVSFEYDENGGSGRLTLKDAELSNIRTAFDLEIVLKGKNKIKTMSASIFIAPNNLTFSGNGGLAIETDRDSIICNEMIVESGDISISIQVGRALADVQKLTVNGGTLELATTNTDPRFGVLYENYGGINPQRVINIALGADRRMITGTNSDGTDAVITEATDKTAIATAKYVYIGEKHDHCACGGNTNIGDHTTHSDLTWMPWTATDKLPDKAGCYYLIHDVTLSTGTAALQDGVNLCLNGKTVKGTGASYTKLSINGALTVTDCGKAGSFGDLAINEGAFTMTGSAGNEGVLQINGGTDFTMTGNAQNNSRIILNETSDAAKIVFGGSSAGSGTVRVSQPQYGAGIRVEGSAKLAGLAGETQGIYIRLTMKEKAEITVDNLGFRALSMSGESIIRGKVTGADASSSFTMGDNARIDGDIELGDNKVDGKVICTGNIISGIFNEDVICSGEIQEGIFHGNVENNGKITGGIFYGTVSGTGTIEDSARVTVNFDSDGGGVVAPQKILRGQKATAPAAPAKVGFVFGNWTVGGAAFDFTAPITSDTTLRAAWTLCDHSASTAQPTCTEQATCTVCQGKYGKVLGHSYGEPTYTWNGTSCTAERVCGRDASHKETETVTATVTVTQHASCTRDELSAYTATFTNTAFAVQKRENIKTAGELGHSYGEPAYTWNGRSCTAERVCGRDASHRETETVTAATVVTQNRSCICDELSAYTAAFTNPAFAVQKKENIKTADRLGHNFRVQQRNETQHWNKCSRCNVISAKENHTGGTATCSAKAECVVCHAKYGEIDTNNHSGLEKVAGVPATAANTGTREYWRCNACGKLFADAAGKNEITSLDMTLEKLAPTIIEGGNGKWNKGCEGGLTFRSDAAYADFIEVLVDGSVISTDNYTAREGSTIVELKADYLASLTEGEHTVTIRSASGDATTQFTVEAMILAPKTGPADTAAWEIGAVVVLGILIVAVVVFVIHKRKTTETD